MGWSIRKSINMGPVRVNLSKSGVGVSAGVKGLRISKGPRGTQVTAGRGGLHYKTTLSTAVKRSSKSRPSAVPVDADDQDTGLSPPAKGFFHGLVQFCVGIAVLAVLGLVLLGSIAAALKPSSSSPPPSLLASAPPVVQPTPAATVVVQPTPAATVVATPIMTALAAPAPFVSPMERLQQDLDAAIASYQATKADALKRLHASPAYTSAKLESDTAWAKLVALRNAGDMTGRLDASTAATKKADTLRTMDSYWLAHDGDCLAAQARIDKLSNQIAAETASQQRQAIAQAKEASDAKAKTAADAQARAKAQADADALAKAQANSPTVVDPPMADATPSPATPSQSDRSSPPPTSSTPDGGTYTGPRGGVYHYSKNGNKVYESHGGGHRR